MKRSHIVGIILIAVAIGAMLTTLTDSSTYAEFSQAFNNPEMEYHVVGTLNKEGELVYNPTEIPDLFAFEMVDRKGVTKQVFLHIPKPQDFERSEQIVLIGKASTEDDAFHAREILMKCPSKYNDGTNDFKTEEEMREIRMKEQAKEARL
jgi:cytochrome c-type biogenesis protein CcmE